MKVIPDMIWKVFITAREWVRNLSLARKFIFLFVSVIFLPISTISVVTINQLYQNNRNTLLENGQQGFGQVVSYLDYRMDNVYRTAMTISADENLRRIFSYNEVDMNNAQLISNYQDLIKARDSLSEYHDIENFVFYVNDNYFFSTGYRFGKIEQLKLTKWFENANSTPKVLRLAKIINDDASTEGSDEYIATVKAFTSPDDYSTITAYVRLDILKDEIVQMLERSTIADGQIVYLVSESNELLCTNKEKEISTNDWYNKTNAIRINAEYDGREFAEYTIKGQEYYAGSSKINHTNCYVISMIPKKNVYNYVIVLLVRTFTYIFIAALFSCIVFLLFVKNITKRIYKLSNAFSNAESGSFVELEVMEKDEIGNMIRSYNYMVKEISSLLDQQFKNGKKMANMELIALQSQINPHFLYNTLDMINWMAQAGELDEVQNMVETLSEYYRLTLNKGNDIITIRDEVQMCKMYGLIQQKRFNNKIKVEIDMDHKVLDYSIPKITLQPLIENAINHGIREKFDGRGTVQINGWIEDDNIIITVSDDGVGMVSLEDTKQKRKGNHYGVRNIEARLCLYYGMDQALTFQSIVGAGTKVTIKIKKISMSNKN